MLPPAFTSNYLNRLELLKIHSRRAFLGTRQGGHVSPKRGHGIEFADYREYVRGDHPRYIDWGVYARTDRLYVKRFQEEQALSVLIILDSSASMRTPVQEKKWDMARDIALSLAYIALMSQDSVSLCCPGIFHSPALFGGRSIHTLCTYLKELKLSSSSNFGEDMNLAASRIRFPGLAIVISDFLMPFESIETGFESLMAKNLDISAIQVLGSSDLTPLEHIQSALAIDSETGEEVELEMDSRLREEYVILLKQHNQNIKKFFSGTQIPYLLALSTEELSEIVLTGVSQMGILR